MTIVMYHYVRPLAESAFPRIKGMELKAFHAQLDYMSRRYRFVSAAQVIDAARGGQPLPESPVLLTFDDGYSDHFRFVFPVLEKRRINGLFFPTACAVQDGILPDVAKIHFILASTTDCAALVKFIDDEIGRNEDHWDLLPISAYRERYWQSNRFDEAGVNYIKRMLQRGLPGPFRARLTERLFQSYVSKDEQAFAGDLYMSMADLQTMAAAGMEIGSHGYGHDWLDSLPEAEQARDIDRSLDFLQALSGRRRPFLFCFPYGAYNADTLRILNERSCSAAFTTKVGLADLPTMDLLQLPRVDTNDIRPD